MYYEGKMPEYYKPDPSKWMIVQPSGTMALLNKYGVFALHPYGPIGFEYGSRRWTVDDRELEYMLQVGKICRCYDCLCCAAYAFQIICCNVRGSFVGRCKALPAPESGCYPEGE